MTAIAISFTISLVALFSMSAVVLARRPKPKGKWTAAVARVWVDRFIAAIMITGSLFLFATMGLDWVSGWWSVPFALFGVLMLAIGSLIISVSMSEMQDIRAMQAADLLPDPIREEDLDQGINWKEVEDFLRQHDKS